MTKAKRPIFFFFFGIEDIQPRASHILTTHFLDLFPELECTLIQAAAGVFKWNGDDMNYLLLCRS